MTILTEATMRHDRQQSHTLTDSDKQIAVFLAKHGFQHKRIAALFDVNQGRISEAVSEAERSGEEMPKFEL